LEAQVVGATLHGVGFGFYSDREAQSLSVCALTNPQTFDVLGNPLPGGLYDPSLGPIDFQARCETCSLIYRHCPGHFGHIPLVLPVYHPILFRELVKLMRATCLNCHRFKMRRSLASFYLTKFCLLSEGKLMEALRYEREWRIQLRKEAAERSEKARARASRQVGHPEISLSDSESDEDEEMHQQQRDALLTAAGAALDQNDAAEESSSGARRLGEPSHLVSERRSTLRKFFADMPTVKCANCGSHCPAISQQQEIKIFRAPPPKSSASSKAKAGARQPSGAANRPTLLPPNEVMEHMQKLWASETDLLSHIWQCGPRNSRLQPHPNRIDDYRMFFLRTVLVAPPRFRPVNRLGDQLVEHPQNVYLSKILTINDELLADFGQGAKPSTTLSTRDMTRTGHLQTAWATLQSAVNFLMDSSRGSSPFGVNAGASQPPPGIRQLLEKKEGMFRRQMMGKRVNFAARSVIAPDPYIATNEIGLPNYFATNLTYPEPVTTYNYHQLAEAVINGPDVHPGANAVEDEKGYLIRLDRKTKSQRAAIARTLRTSSAAGGMPRRVHRHCRDGDVVLLNRQPTLHKPGIMAHRVRVLGAEKAIRMHYANCNTYNADFDGDEMNVHMPQDEISRAEAYELAFSDRQYLVPRDGSPLRGLIQDNIDTGILLTKKDIFFERHEISQLLYTACSGGDPVRPILLPPPAILLPVQRWTGKQVITALLNYVIGDSSPLQLKSRCKIVAKLWGTCAPEEVDVIIRQNEMLTGVLEKSQFGASKYGLVHAVHELYGPLAAGNLLTSLCRLFTSYLQFRGFTCGMDDLLLTAQAEEQRTALIDRASRIGTQVASAFAARDQYQGAEHQLSSEEITSITAGMKDRLLAGERESEVLDGMMKSGMHETTSRIIGACLPDGQRKLFPLNNLSLMTVSGAKGSVVNFSQISCLLGQQELEGKRVPRMPSGRTLPSFDPYDPSPRAGGFIGDRFLSGIRPQEYYFHCMAGREGLVDTAVKTANSGYLQRCLIKQLESLRVHYDLTVRGTDGGVIQFNYGEDGLDVCQTPYLHQFEFICENYEGFLDKYQTGSSANAVDVTSAMEYKRHARKNKLTDNDPVLSVLNPSLCLGSVSDRFEQELEAFMKSDDAKKYFKKSKKSTTPFARKQYLRKNDFKALMYLKYMQSLAHPGEAVGLLASQSVGEPSTQMTLNTFHLAGRGEANVTLGIPRLREIVMTASSKIRTPTMVLPIRAGLPEDAAAKLARLFECLRLQDLLTGLRVVERLRVGPSGARSRAYAVHIGFCAQSLKEASLTFARLVDSLETRFIPLALRALNKHLANPASGRKVMAAAAPSPKGGAAAATEEEMDGEATAAAIAASAKQSGETTAEDGSLVEKVRRKKGDGVGYADADEEDLMAIRRQGADSDDNDESRGADEEEEEEEEGGKRRKNKEQKKKKSTKKSTPIAKPSLQQAAAAPTELSSCKKTLLHKYSMLRDYEFDKTTCSATLQLNLPATGPKVMMLNILETVVEDFVVQSIPGLSKCFVIEYEDPITKVKGPAVQTEGVNFSDVFAYGDIIDTSRIYTNDINAIRNVYGVEAANAAICSEVSGVFGVYGISVDRRHLSLVSDYMTFEGGYKPFNRIGISSDPSPLLKMSFETTMQFLTQAAMSHEVDPIRSPAASLVMGQIVENGTGCFGLRSKPLEF